MAVVVAMAPHVEQCRIVHPVAAVPRMLRTKPLNESIVRRTSAEAIMGHVVECLEQDDRKAGIDDDERHR